MLKIKLVQFAGIVRYELKLHIRAKGLVSLMLGLLLMFLLVAILRESIQQSSETGRGEITFNLVGLSCTLVYIIMILLCPPFVADIVPRDRQLQVSELLESTPLTPGVYLAGKLAGMWAALLGGLALVLPLAGLWLWLVFGPYDLGVALQALLAFILPLSLFNSALALLLAAGISSRRKAIFLGVALSLASILMLSLHVPSSTAVTDPNAGISFWDTLNLSRPAIFRQFSLNYFKGLVPQNETIVATYFSGPVLQTILAGFAEVGICWTGMWLWLRRRMSL